MAALALASPLSAAADELQLFELAKTRFDGGQYEEAAARFSVLLTRAEPPCGPGPSDPDHRCRITDPDLIERASALYAASLIALGRGADADAIIESLLLANPAYTPNPAVFQPEVIDRFTVVRARIREKLETSARAKAEAERQKRLAAGRLREEEQRWIADLERLASEERIVERRSRWVAAMPFGVGQFYNGDTGLGWFFLAGQALTGATTVASAFVVAGYEGVDVSPPPTTSGQEQSIVDIDQLNDRIQTATLINRVAFGAWAVLTVAGIVHAQATFVPERSRVQKRKIPLRPRPTITPSISAAPGNLGVGLSGRF
ncbi:hypothetical protein [Chondromyces crocatus]|uniref:Uncharacterized protein n=1 Tax=Chondromyces crocatus TaxID=52 RepID=A0A0K1EFN2_CHOCO|nr:hypothetical protein [Chondromyces crocatus]AKT39649.1 uncharacterized protein CMC5_037980 [Chondromyces crocatus]